MLLLLVVVLVIIEISLCDGGDRSISSDALNVYHQSADRLLASTWLLCGLFKRDEDNTARKLPTVNQPSLECTLALMLCDRHHRMALGENCI